MTWRNDDDGDAFWANLRRIESEHVARIRAKPYQPTPADAEFAVSTKREDGPAGWTDEEKALRAKLLAEPWSLTLYPKRPPKRRRKP